MKMNARRDCEPHRSFAPTGAARVVSGHQKYGMRSILASSIELLKSSVQQVAGESVTYRRQTDSIDALTATPVRVAIEDYSAEQEISATTLDTDWLIWADDLVIRGERSLPKVGDIITWIDCRNLTHNYRVCVRNADGGRCYRFADPSKQYLRVFTVESKGGAE